MALQSAFTLNPNEIFGSIANMIISQEVFADNIGKNQKLVDKARVDGSMYGDKKLYYATDALKTVAWGADQESANLLALDRPEDPEVQDITLDVFRQIRLTVDNYLTKRAWSDEGTFSAFNSVMLGWMRVTKDIYDGTTYNCFIGTHQSVDAKVKEVSITLDGTKDGQLIAQSVADLLVKMSDYSRDYNDYGFMRSYDPSEVKVIWNAEFVNEIKNVDLPTIFHKEGLESKLDGDVMPARYFGTINTAKTTGDGAKVRSLVEQEIGSNHYFAGDLIATTDEAPAGTSYTEDDTVIAKVLVKLPPYMSAFEVGTSFFNPRSLTENHYLTFGHNTIEYLKNYPYITIKKAA